VDVPGILAKMRVCDIVKAVLHVIWPDRTTGFQSVGSSPAGRVFVRSTMQSMYATPLFLLDLEKPSFLSEWVSQVVPEDF
jgi:hypothetical protein